MNVTNYAVKPYQTSKATFGGSGVVHHANNSNLSFNTFGSSSSVSHLGCSTIHNKKLMWIAILSAINIYWEVFYLHLA
ncbi:hypothetical protein [Mesoplasma syrphidae]|uniref:hypothetical protein n=1 Tax=Mesoplasma syrphidae TaxID=225999 RepID=UPI0012ECD8AD|nr:hypothetical protein [Mesoplasma syrphidae]